ncbi:type II toxin-antitoxin system PemK/MazF family toxin [candidate division WOR-3 bacterium]|nr:type II toxin-antitoxin system PemK/MazF family toxin [candidate division WOR-3 bacterium]
MKHGDIVLIEHQPTANDMPKPCPALVISSDRYNAREADRILIPFSSNTTRCCPDDILIERNDTCFPATGLHCSSVIRVGKILTMHKSKIKRLLGHPPNSMMDRVKIQIKLTFNIN